MSKNKLSPLERLKQTKTDEIRALKKLLLEIEKEQEIINKDKSVKNPNQSSI